MRTVATRGLVLLAGLVLAILLGVWVVSDVVGPFLEGGRVVHHEVGFAVSFPRDWEYAEAAVITAGHREHDWWDDDYGDPAQQHAEFVAADGVVMARTTALMSSHQWCDVYDLSEDAAMGWDSLADAVAWYVSYEARQQARDTEVAYLDLPAGRVASIEGRDADGLVRTQYIYTDGAAWFELRCSSYIPPEDRWLSIAETFEFLPAEE